MFSVQGKGVSVQGGVPVLEGLYPGGSLSRGGGLCPGGSLSREGPLSKGGSMSRGRGSLSRGRGVSVREGLCPGGSLSKGGLCQGAPPNMVTCGWYASYWNAFVLF